MNEEEAKKILNDPKKILDLFRVFHQLIHVYEAQELQKQKPGSKEKLGLRDSVNIQLNNEEVNK